MILLRTLLIFLTISTIAVAQTLPQSNTQTFHSRESRPTMSLPDGFASNKGVSGAMGASIDHYIVFAGGCNFPDKPAADGGKKVYYSEIFRGKKSFSDDSISWVSIGKLPEERAYAAYCNYGDRLIIVGGENSQGALASGYAISASGDIKALPSLPQPRTGMGFARVGNRLYIIGGVASGKPTSTSLSLDLNNTSAGWKDEPEYPGGLRLKITASATPNQDGLVMVTSFSLPSAPEPVEATPTVYTLDTLSRSWTKGTLPHRLLRNGVSFGGGYAFLLPHLGVAFGGGVNTKRFTPALQRIQNIERAKQRGKSKEVEKLQRQVRSYLRQSPSYHAFNSEIWFYEAGGHWTEELRSKEFPKLHYQDYQIAEYPNVHPLSRADACIIPIYNRETQTYSVLIVGGEIQPGIRTRHIGIIYLSGVTNLGRGF